MSRDDQPDANLKGTLVCFGFGNSDNAKHRKVSKVYVGNR